MWCTTLLGAASFSFCEEESVRMAHTETIGEKYRDIAYEAADKELETGEADFTINVEDLAKACNISSSIAAKGGPQDHASAAKTRRRGGASHSQDFDASGTAPGGKLQGRLHPAGSESKQPVSSSSSAKPPSGKGGLPRKSLGV
jgi:hypothetical protein